MADIGERLGGDDIHFTTDQPLRVIIGGPPHSGKSTLMNLLEDRFQYYQIPVELLDLDLSSPTPLKAGFTEQREKKAWTSTLADEARSMFEEAEGVQVVLGDSVGLISEINEIISQPADVAILLVSGGHGDYDTTYRKVVRKWKEYYEDIHKPLLVVLRSTMNPADESMFDPQDNYGVIVGMDRDAYDENTISGHYRYEGLYPSNACLEGIVFEIAQSFDMKVRSPTDPEHLALLNSKWPELKDKKTWTPPAGSMLGGIERAYFQERGRVPADQRAESFGAEGGDIYIKTCGEEWKSIGGVPKSKTWVSGYFSSYDAAMKDAHEEEDAYDANANLFEKNGRIIINASLVVGVEMKRRITIIYQKVRTLGAESFSAELHVWVDKCKECRGTIKNEWEYITCEVCGGWAHEWCSADIENIPKESMYEFVCNSCAEQGFDAESFGAEDDLTFQEWADQEMMTHGKPEPFDDWLNDELSHHGDNVSLHDWGNHELDSHYERYGAETVSPYYRGYRLKRETSPSIRSLESRTRRRIKQEAAYSQMMIASLIGLGAGLWGVSKWRDSQRSL